MRKKTGVLGKLLYVPSHRVLVKAIDGKKVKTGTFSILQSLLSVRPGVHTATVSMDWVEQEVPTIKFSTEAAHTYRIQAMPIKGRLWVWVEVVTKFYEVVAGERPPGAPIPSHSPAPAYYR